MADLCTQQENGLQYPPRLYQRELFNIACQRNVIIRADTGSGKTFVSIMCAKHFYEQACASSPYHKVIIFIVPTVALVDQQVEQFKNHTNLKVSGFRGDMNVDIWSKEKWQQEISISDVIVLTPQILCNIFSTAYITILEVALLIFDEAHHATKGHPYNRIMQLFYHPFLRSNPDKRDEMPHIIGLTASPIYNAKNYEAMRKAINTLESNLNALVVEVKTNVEEVSQYAYRPDEQTLLYQAHIPNQCEIDISDFVNDTLVQNGIDMIKGDEVAHWQSQFGYLGLRAYYLFILDQMITLDKDPIPEEHVEVIKSVRSEIIDKFHVPTHEDTTDKVSKLIDLLKSCNNVESFSAIIFVERRTHTQVLTDILSSVPSLKFISATPLVGHNSETGIGMKTKQQQEAIAGFRSGKYNVIVATQVAEEGLDFPACNLVVRFDQINTITSYVQSRGRARRNGSTYVVMMSREKRNKAESYADNERAQRNLFLNRSDAENVEEPFVEKSEVIISETTGAKLDHSIAISRLEIICSQLSTDPFTPVLRPVYEILTLPVQPSRYIANVTLPHAAYLSAEQRTLTGDSAPSKSLAKQSVAFKACKLIYEQGGLDDHFLPFRRKKQTAAERKYSKASKRIINTVARIDAAESVEKANENIQNPTEAASVLSAGPENALDVKGKESFECENPLGVFSENQEIWMQVVHLSNANDPQDEIISLGVITSKDTRVDKKAFKLWSRYEGMTLDVTFGDNQQLSLGMEPAQIEHLWRKIDTYSRTLIQLSVNKKAIDIHLSHHVIPVISRDEYLKKLQRNPLPDDYLHPLGFYDYVIDWHVADNLLPYTTMSDLQVGQLIAVPYHGTPSSRLFYFEAIRHDVNLASPLTNTETYEGTWFLAKSLRNFENYQNFLQTRLNLHKHEIKLPFLQLKAITPPTSFQLSTKYPIPTDIEIQKISSRKPPPGVIIPLPAGENNEINISDSSGPHDDSLIDSDNPFESLSQSITRPPSRADSSFSKSQTRRPPPHSAFTMMYPSNALLPTPAPTPPGEKEKEKVIPPKKTSKRARILDQVESNTAEDGKKSASKNEGKLQPRVLLPISVCRTPTLSIRYLRKYHAMPAILRVITDRVVAANAIEAFKLPPIDINLAVEALTLPSCNAEVNYQSLETYGDSVLKVCTTVHMYLKYPKMVEGILSVKRQRKVDNCFLGRLAINKGFGKYVISELLQLTNWVPPMEGVNEINAECSKYKRTIPIKSLADCMESMLGAAYKTGFEASGISLAVEYALATGSALGMDFGGPVPWHKRPNFPKLSPSPVPPRLLELAQTLGYKFFCGNILLQACTHKSDLKAKTYCYEREEFLGDAILDLCIVQKLYENFPMATPRQLSSLRSLLVNNSVLSYIAVNTLDVHKIILHASPALKETIEEAEKEILRLSPQDMLERAWSFGFPKVLADVVEAIFGAIFIDSKGNLEQCNTVIMRLFADFFDALNENPDDDPTAKLLRWELENSCKQMARKVEKRGDCVDVEISFHGKVIGRGLHQKRMIAKATAANEAFDFICKMERKNGGRACGCAQRHEADVLQADIIKKEKERKMKLVMKQGTEISTGIVQDPTTSQFCQDDSEMDVGMMIPPVKPVTKRWTSDDRSNGPTISEPLSKSQRRSSDIDVARNSHSEVHKQEYTHRANDDENVMIINGFSSDEYSTGIPLRKQKPTKSSIPSARVTSAYEVDDPHTSAGPLRRDSASSRRSGWALENREDITKSLYGRTVSHKNHESHGGKSPWQDYTQQNSPSSSYAAAIGNHKGDELTAYNVKKLQITSRSTSCLPQQKYRDYTNGNTVGNEITMKPQNVQPVPSSNKSPIPKQSSYYSYPKSPRSGHEVSLTQNPKTPSTAMEKNKGKSYDDHPRGRLRAWSSQDESEKRYLPKRTSNTAVHPNIHHSKSEVSPQSRHRMYTTVSCRAEASIPSIDPDEVYTPPLPQSRGPRRFA